MDVAKLVGGSDKYPSLRVTQIRSEVSQKCGVHACTVLQNPVTDVDASIPEFASFSGSKYSYNHLIISVSRNLCCPTIAVSM